MSELTYLHVRGTLIEDMIYHPLPGYESPTPRRLLGEPDDAYELLLLDPRGQVLVASVPHVRVSGCGTVADPIRRRMSGTLPLHPEGATILLRHSGRTLHERAVTPEVPPLDDVVTEQTHAGVRVSWVLPSREVTYDVLVTMKSGHTFLIERGLTTPSYELDLSAIPQPGAATMSIRAGDGVRSTETDLAEVEVPARRPTVYIIEPSHEVTVPFGRPLPLLGCCLDMAGRPMSPESLVWLLDDVPLSRGHAVAALDDPQPGAHRLTLTHGEAADRVETFVDIEVDEPDEDYHAWAQVVATDH